MMLGSVGIALVVVVAHLSRTLEPLWGFDSVNILLRFLGWVSASSPVLAPIAFIAGVGSALLKADRLLAVWLIIVALVQTATVWLMLRTLHLVHLDWMLPRLGG